MTSDIELDTWHTGLRSCSRETIQTFLQNETDEEVLLGLIHRETARGEPNRELIGLINKRLQELR